MENSNYLKKWRQLPQNEKDKIIKDIETAKADIIQSNHLQFLQTVGSTGYFKVSDIIATSNDNFLNNGYKLKDDLVFTGFLQELEEIKEHKENQTCTFKPIVLSDLGNWFYLFTTKKAPVKTLFNFSKYVYNIDELTEKILKDIKTNNTDVSIILQNDSDKEIYFIFKKAIRITLMMGGVICLNSNNNFVIAPASNLVEYNKTKAGILNVTTKKILLIVQAMKNADGKGNLKATCPKQIYEELEDNFFKNIISDEAYEYIKEQLLTKPRGTKLINLFEYITILL